MSKVNYIDPVTSAVYTKLRGKMKNGCDVYKHETIGLGLKDKPNTILSSIVLVKDGNRVKSYSREVNWSDDGKMHLNARWDRTQDKHSAESFLFGHEGDSFTSTHLLIKENKDLTGTVVTDVLEINKNNSQIIHRPQQVQIY